MGHQQSSWSRPGTGQFKNEIADLPAVRDLAMGLIKTQQVARRPRLAKLIDKELHDCRFLTTEAGNGQRLKQQIVGMLQVSLRHGGKHSRLGERR